MTAKNAASEKAKHLSSAMATGFGVALTLVTLLALVLLGWVEYEKIVQTDRERAEMQARLLEDQATRSVDNVAIALKSLARDIEQAKMSAGSTATDQTLAQAANALPNVRSLSVVTANGRVQSSSATSDLGLEIDISHFGTLPLPGQERLADFVRGRSLAALNRNAPAADATAAIGFIPLIYGLNNLQEEGLYLVALINPDSFASYQLLALNNPRIAAYLISYQGSILASSGSISRSPGSRLVEHPVLKKYLPDIEHGSYLGNGTSSDKQIVAFRLSTTRPLVIVLEQPYADSLALWFKTMRWFAVVAGLTMLFLAFMTHRLVRSLRSRERSETKLKEAQQKLKHQLDFVGLLLDASPTPVWTMNSAGRYLSVNRAWEDFKGLSRQQVSGRLASEFLPHDEYKLHFEHDARVWATGEQIRYQDRLSHRDGSRRDVVITKLLVPGDERFGARLLNTIMDISEIREAERATREARDVAQESLRAKSEFISNISRELKTPLQSILGFSELGIIRGQQSPKLQSMFTDINTSGTRMVAMINDLLDSSRNENSLGAVMLESSDVRSLINEVLHELSPQLAKKRLQLDTEMGSQPLIVKLHPMHFAQVVRNVVANAITFSAYSSRIEVSAWQINDEIRGTAQVCISVRDHGAGIPPNELGSIFEAFVQPRKAGDRSGGVGLGLAICRRILETHNGRIVAANMPDGGAVFRIYLPARKAIDRQTDFGTMA